MMQNIIPRTFPPLFFHIHYTRYNGVSDYRFNSISIIFSIFAYITYYLQIINTTSAHIIHGNFLRS
jgi:hypothetical protein